MTEAENLINTINGRYLYDHDRAEVEWSVSNEQLFVIARSKSGTLLEIDEQTQEQIIASQALLIEYLTTAPPDAICLGGHPFEWVCRKDGTWKCKCLLDPNRVQKYTFSSPHTEEEEKKPEILKNYWLGDRKVS